MHQEGFTHPNLFCTQVQVRRLWCLVHNVAPVPSTFPQGHVLLGLFKDAVFTGVLKQRLSVEELGICC